MKRPAVAVLASLALLIIAVTGVATIPSVQTGTWQPMGSMVAARSGAAAVLLDDHRVLVAGGNDANGPVNSAEVFNLDGSFSSVSPMAVARAGHRSILLEDGRVLVNMDERVFPLANASIRANGPFRERTYAMNRNA